MAGETVATDIRPRPARRPDCGGHTPSFVLLNALIGGLSAGGVFQTLRGHRLLVAERKR